MSAHLQTSFMMLMRYAAYEQWLTGQPQLVQDLHPRHHISHKLVYCRRFLVAVACFLCGSTSGEVQSRSQSACPGEEHAAAARGASAAWLPGAASRQICS
jgi:hypothetical protein